MILATENPIVFSLYVQLIYTGHIPSKVAVTLPDVDTEYEYLCELYALAYKLKDVAAQNHAIEALHAKSNEIITDDVHKVIRDATLPSRGEVDLVYVRTLGPCGARRLLVDLYTSRAKSYHMRKQEDPWPADFMNDLALSLMETRFATGNRAIKPVESYYDTMPAEDVEDEEEAE
jgi:hypothetical protein